MQTINWNSGSSRMSFFYGEKNFFSKHWVKSALIRNFFWSVFFHIRTEYGEIRSQSECRKIRTRESSVFGHFLCSENVKNAETFSKIHTLGKYNRFSEFWYAVYWVFDQWIEMTSLLGKTEIFSDQKHRQIKHLTGQWTLLKLKGWRLHQLQRQLAVSIWAWTNIDCIDSISSYWSY